MTKIEPCEVCQCADEGHTEADCGEYLAKRHAEILAKNPEWVTGWEAHELMEIEQKLKRLSE